MATIRGSVCRSPSVAQALLSIVSGLYSFTRQNRFVHFRAGLMGVPPSGTLQLAIPRGAASWLPRVGIWQGGARTRVRGTPGPCLASEAGPLPGSLWNLFRLKLPILSALDQARAHPSGPHLAGTSSKGPAIGQAGKGQRSPGEATATVPRLTSCSDWGHLRRQT